MLQKLKCHSTPFFIQVFIDLLLNHFLSNSNRLVSFREGNDLCHKRCIAGYMQ